MFSLAAENSGLNTLCTYLADTSPAFQIKAWWQRAALTLNSLNWVQVADGLRTASGWRPARNTDDVSSIREEEAGMTLFCLRPKNVLQGLLFCLPLFYFGPTADGPVVQFSFLFFFF